jgi:hypothetical protein
MADFPTVALANLEDSKHFTESSADPVKRYEVEGGYTVTRPRYTRLPRKTWTTGFTDLTTVEKDSFVSFWESKKGGSESFTYLNPADSQTYTVRFKGVPKIKYTGMATLRRWEITGITLEQV